MNSSFVLITGPTSGIGRAFADYYASQGYALFLVSRNAEQLYKLKEQFTVPVEVFVADLSTEKDCDRLLTQLDRRQIQVSTLINNAGFGIHATFDTHDKDELLQLLRLNILSLTRLTHHLLPMIKKQQGRILNVSSVAGYLSGPYMAIYYASKAYVNSFTRALREEVRKTGVHVSLLCPGPTDTQFGARASKGKKHYSNGLMSAERVALAGIQGLEKNKALIIPGFTNKLIVFLAKFLPVWATVRLVAYIQRKTHD